MSSSITATNDKVLKWCQALHDEGLLSEIDLDKCTSQFAQLNDSIPYATASDITINEELVKREMGLTPEQIRQATLDPVKYILNNDKRHTIQIEIGDIHVDNETNILRRRKRLEAPTRFNLIHRGIQTGCLLQVVETGRYVTLKQKDSRGHNILAVANLETPDAGSYFRLKSIDTSKPSVRHSRKWVFESITNPGQALELLGGAINMVVLSQISAPGQYLDIHIVKESRNMTADKGDPMEFVAEDARQQVDNILANINQHRLEYYRLLAMKEYLLGLRDKMRQIVAQNGPVMDYYYQTLGQYSDMESLKNNNQQQLLAIQSSISSELESQEIANITNMINQLEEQARAYAAGPLATSTAKIPLLMTSIETAIRRRNDQIKQLDEVLGKVNREQSIITEELNRLESQKSANQVRNTVSSTNDNIVRLASKTHVWNYWSSIALILLLVLCISVFGYKLWNTAKQELA